MIKLISTLTLALAIPTITSAAPVYLNCQVNNEKEKKNFSVMLDESTGKVTHTGEKGSAFNTNGFFSANKVSYQSITTTPQIKATFRYEIDRSDLSIEESFTLEPFDPKYLKDFPATTKLMNGSCNIVTLKNRKL